MKPIGLRDGELAELQRLCASSPRLERARLFGSRARCTHRPGSDLDLVLNGSALADGDVAALYGAFDQSRLPYKVDLVLVDAHLSPAIRASIERDGVDVFVRSAASRIV